MPEYNIQQISGIVNGQVFGNSNRIIRYLLTDSRGVDFPAESLFFAIKGIRHDGHKFINDLYKLGVRCFIVEHIPSGEITKDVTFIRVADSLKALQNLCGWHRRQFRNKVLAITGSNGKTIVKEWIYHAIQPDMHVVRSPKSYNSQIGVPLSLWQMDPQYDLAIIEAGISQPGEMARLEQMIRPDIGIFTNLGEPHQENFIDYRQKCAEKLLLFKNCRQIIYCRDHPLIDELLSEPSFSNVSHFTWSARKEADLRVRSIDKENSHTEIELDFKDKSFSVTIPFIDDASIENVLHVAAFLLMTGIKPSTVTERLENLTSVAMRLELKRGINNCTIINDSYNSDLGSLAIALDFLNHQHQHEKKAVILSDILQSGRSSDELYSEVARLMVQKNVRHFVGIGSELMQNYRKFPENSVFYSSTEDFLKVFRKEHFSDEVILLKGSRMFEFEKILKELEAKVHETVMEINLNAMVHNLNYFRSKLYQETKVVAMVKAFSYGSGSFEIANILQFHRIDYLAVAFADEGVALRESGITVPIMVMNPEKSSFDQIINNQLEPEIYSFRVLGDFAEVVRNHGQFNYPVHIKLDTGMHRLGFMEHQCDDLINILKSREQIMVKSVFSHLAGADESVFDTFTRQQLTTFRRMSDKITASFSHPVLRHILNSAGIERFPEYQFDMVRLGIGLYGLSVVDQKLVRQVSTLKSVILQIKEIEENETVGYSRKFKAARTTRVGIIPIGYADGLHRVLGNGAGKLMIRGELVPIIGNICMDMCMVDLTGMEVQEGDEVVVFGESYPITEIAGQMGTIPYEVLTAVSQRVKRVYYQE